MDTKLIVSASPHVRSEETTQSLMANVIVALCPCVVASAIIFGMRALLVTAVSVVACVAFEWLYCKLHADYCFNCGSCSFVCPAKRPVTQMMSLAKAFYLGEIKKGGNK